MSRRKVTMLEAFQDSARTSEDRRDASLRRSTAAPDRSKSAPSGDGSPELGADAPAQEPSMSPGPFAPARSVHDGPAIVPVDEARPGSAAGAAAGKAGRPGEAGAEGASTVTLPISRFGFLTLQLLLLAGAFLLGRELEVRGLLAFEADAPDAASSAVLGSTSFAVPASAGVVRGPDARSEGITPEVPADTQAVTSAGSEADAGAPPSVNGADPDTAADLAFVDPAMSYTVLAITYSGTEANRALAWQTYDLLQAEGFPVVKPLERNARIFLFVGAAGAIADLGEVRDRLQKLRVGPRETPDFREAYVVNLDLYR